MPITTLTQIPVNPDQFDQALQLVKNSAEQTRSSSGCNSFSILLNSENRTEIFFLEVWDNQESQQAYIEQRMSDGSMDQLARFFAGPPVTSVLATEA